MTTIRAQGHSHNASGRVLRLSLAATALWLSTQGLAEAQHGTARDAAPPPKAAPARQQTAPAERPHKPSETRSTRSVGSDAARTVQSSAGQRASGEQRLTMGEVLIELAGTPSQERVQALASRHRLVRVESRPMPLTGSTFYRWRIPDRRSIPEVVRQLEADPAIRSAQPNYVYSLQQGVSPQGAAGALDAPQYALAKLNIGQAHRLARGERVLVAVIDSGIDAAHPDLAGAIVEEFDAVGAGVGQKAHPHGTGIAGIIAGRGRLSGAAPAARILAIRAFAATKGGSDGTTFAIIKGLDYATAQGARIVNMSFAGPRDPALSRLMAAAQAKGTILIAAAGNAGPKSAPLYPAADPSVISVTATDADNAIFAQANRGDHIDVSAPGVGILAPAPGASYQMASGTSFAAAYVSGVAALLLERRPKLVPDALKRILLSTAQDLGPKGRDADFGNGLVDAFRALRAFDPPAEAVAADLDER